MKIGILGAGYVGRTLGTLAVRAGHRVMLANSRGPQTLFSLARAVGGEVGTAEEAEAFGDIAVVAVPFSARAALPAGPLAGKVVLDTMNYYHERDGHIPELDTSATTTSEITAALLPGSRIVKAFNAIVMGDLERDGRPAGAADRRGLPLAGDDAEGKAIASELYEAFGFDPVDVGALAEGWRFERGRPVYCVPMSAAALRTALAATRREDRPAGS